MSRSEQEESSLLLQVLSSRPDESRLEQRADTRSTVQPGLANDSNSPRIRARRCATEALSSPTPRIRPVPGKPTRIVSNTRRRVFEYLRGPEFVHTGFFIPLENVFDLPGKRQCVYTSRVRFCEHRRDGRLG